MSTQSRTIEWKMHDLLLNLEFVDGLTNQIFEEALSKCLFNCPDGEVANGSCVKIDMNKFIDDAAE